MEMNTVKGIKNKTRVYHYEINVTPEKRPANGNKVDFKMEIDDDDKLHKKHKLTLKDVFGDLPKKEF